MAEATTETLKPGLSIFAQLARFWGWVGGLGKKLISFLMLTVRVMEFVYISLRSPLSERTKGKKLVLKIIQHQVLFTAVHAFSLIGIMGLMFGSIIVVGTLQVLEQYIAFDKLATLIRYVTMRELGPLVVSLIVVARSGTAVVTELGTMRANRETNVLEAMAINLNYFVVFPRLIGMMISMVCLVAYFEFIAMTGGFAIAKFIGVGEAFSVFDIITSVSVADITVSFFKSAVAGVIISGVCCYFGINAPPDFRFVPIQATIGVVNALLLVVLANLSITGLQILVFGIPKII
ncbi:MAG: ABC transporter permease [Planctomycetes bacterium]|nr:ABC transporter permease [Planctomycetota bacterium]